MGFKIINILRGKGYFSNISADLVCRMEDVPVDVADLLRTMGVADINAVHHPVQLKDVIGCRLTSQWDADTMANLLGADGQYLVDYQVDVDATQANRGRRHYAKFDIYRVSDAFHPVDDIGLPVGAYFPRVEVENPDDWRDAVITVGGVEKTLRALMEEGEPITGLVNICGYDYYVVNRPVNEFIDEVSFVPSVNTTSVSFCVDTLRMSNRRPCRSR